MTEELFATLRLEDLKHVNLLWHLRNSLVHEVRMRGHGVDTDEDEKNVLPFYHTMQDLDTNQTTWELVYPIGFLKLLCRNAIKNLCLHFKKIKYDPYRSYTFGSFWIDVLN
jgi:hypothetical protein